QAAPSGEFRAHLDAPVTPRGLPLGRDARRGVVGELRLSPVVAAGAVGGIPVPLLPALDDEHAVFDARVLEPLARVVLALAVADEALLVGPLRRIGRAVVVELVGPDELPSMRLRRGGR